MKFVENQSLLELSVIRRHVNLNWKRWKKKNPLRHFKKSKSQKSLRNKGEYMRTFQIKDGKFKFQIWTDDMKSVVARLIDEKGELTDFFGKALVNTLADDKFDLHYGMHIAIQRAMDKVAKFLKSEMENEINRLEKEISNMKYYDIETFTKFRETRLARIARANAKKYPKIVEVTGEVK